MVQTNVKWVSSHLLCARKRNVSHLLSFVVIWSLPLIVWAQSVSAAPASQNKFASLPQSRDCQNKRFVGKNEDRVSIHFIGDRAETSRKRGCSLLGVLITMSATLHTVCSIHSDSPPPLRYLPHIQDGTAEFRSAAASAHGWWPMEERSLLRKHTIDTL